MREIDLACRTSHRIHHIHMLRTTINLNLHNVTLVAAWLKQIDDCRVCSVLPVEFALHIIEFDFRISVERHGPGSAHQSLSQSSPGHLLILAWNVECLCLTQLRRVVKVSPGLHVGRCSITKSASPSNGRLVLVNRVNLRNHLS